MRKSDTESRTYVRPIEKPEREIRIKDQERVTIWPRNNAQETVFFSLTP